MTDITKISKIIDMLVLDMPATAVGKIMKAVLINMIPSLQTEQLDRLITVLGIKDDETIPESES